MLEAFRSRRVYASLDENLQVRFRLNDELMGGIIADGIDPGEQLRIDGSVSDPDEPGASYQILIFSDTGPGGEIATIAEVLAVGPSEDGRVTFDFDELRYTGSGQYIFLKIEQIDEEGRRDYAWTAPVWIEDADAPSPAGDAVRIHMVSLLPNPSGDESLHEAITLRNSGDSAVSLQAWRIRDLAEREWDLSSEGALDPGETREITRDGRPMALNNSGDALVLIDPDGAIVQSVSYDKTREGQRVSIPAPE